MESVHGKGYVHRDVKPENFVVGRGTKGDLAYLIDYGLAKKFRDLETRKHIPYKNGKKFTGTARYASISNHLGIEQGRRDDLESLAFTLIYLAKGKLPWQGAKNGKKQTKFEKILIQKMDYSPEKLCSGLPYEFVILLKYCRGLNFEDKPDYTEFRKKFAAVFYRKKFYTSFAFDWVTQNVDLNTNIHRASSNNLVPQLVIRYKDRDDSKSDTHKNIISPRNPPMKPEQKATTPTRASPVNHLKVPSPCPFYNSSQRSTQPAGFSPSPQESNNDKPFSQYLELTTSIASAPMKEEKSENRERSVNLTVDIARPGMERTVEERSSCEFGDEEICERKADYGMLITFNITS